MSLPAQSLRFVSWAPVLFPRCVYAPYLGTYLLQEPPDPKLRFCPSPPSPAFLPFSTPREGTDNERGERVWGQTAELGQEQGAPPPAAMSRRRRCQVTGPAAISLPRTPPSR